MYKEFIVQECLKSKQLSAVNSVFRLNPYSTDEVRLIRLLSGTADVEVSRTGQKHKARRNLLTFPWHEVSEARASSFLTCLTPVCTRKELAQYYTKTRHSNAKLFRPLVAEYCHIVSSTSSGNHSKAFIHVYRILELISYMFPLMFASTAGSYFGTYSKLKTFFGEKKEGGELSFFKKFVEDTMGPGFGVKLQFAGVSAEVNRVYVELIRDTIQPSDFHGQTDPNQVEFSVNALIGLVIDIRNRWFHMAIGGKRNLTSFDMPESDDFFEKFNELAVNWIALIYLEVLKVSVQARI